MQEQSVLPIKNYKKFISSVKAFQKKIQKTQKKCQIYLYASWAYKSAADSRQITMQIMEEQYRDAYCKAAKEINAVVCNVGEAFANVCEKHGELKIYVASDIKHPSYIGSFLAVCVLAATLT